MEIVVTVLFWILRLVVGFLCLLGVYWCVLGFVYLGLCHHVRRKEKARRIHLESVLNNWKKAGL